MKNWVILHIRTGCEEKLVRLLKEKLNPDEYLPFLPTKETSHRNKGVIHKECKHLFPGYVFIQTELESKLIMENLKLLLKGMPYCKDFYSILHYGDNKNDVTVRENERIYLERLFNPNFCITGSVGFIEGDMIKITSGVLVGMESQIKKINRHKREATVELEIMGAMRRVTLMLEVIAKI